MGFLTGESKKALKRRTKKAAWVVIKSGMGFLTGEQKKLFNRRANKAAWVDRKSGMGFIDGKQKKRYGFSEKEARVFKDANRKKLFI